MVIWRKPSGLTGEDPTKDRTKAVNFALARLVNFSDLLAGALCNQHAWA